MQEYLAMWKNYANFKDRTSVRGYWMAFLFNFIAAIIIGVIAGIIPFLGFLAGIYSLAALVPGLAINVRRLRDAGRPWYHMFIAFVPLVGIIILIIWLCQQTNSSEGEQV